jgi:quinol monooxygenase YgiN
MVVVVAKLKVQKGKEDEVEKQLRMLVEYVRNEEPGTMTYLCHRAKDDPRTFLFYERYLNEEALEKHSASARFQQIFNRVTPLLAGAPAIEVYEELAGKR